MPRQKNTRPTSIYWLCDTRPEKVAAFGPYGQPFYAGKTVSPDHRLSAHQCMAQKNPEQSRSIRLLECGQHITLRIMEVVAPTEDWCSRERYWIATIRRLYPGGINVSNGGEGAPGWVPSAEVRMKARIARCERNKSPEHRAKISAALKGRKHTPEYCAKISAAKRGTKQSAESNAKRSATQKGRKRLPESVAKTATGLRGNKRSPEVCANISRGKRGLKRRFPFSPETCAKIAEYKKAWWADPINHERASARQIGRSMSIETRAKISATKRAKFAEAARA